MLRFKVQNTCRLHGSAPAHEPVSQSRMVGMLQHIRRHQHNMRQAGCRDPTRIVPSVSLGVCAVFECMMDEHAYVVQDIESVSVGNASRSPTSRFLTECRGWRKSW